MPASRPTQSHLVQILRGYARRGRFMPGRFVLEREHFSTTVLLLKTALRSISSEYPNEANAEMLAAIERLEHLGNFSPVWFGRMAVDKRAYLERVDELAMVLKKHGFPRSDKSL